MTTTKKKNALEKDQTPEVICPVLNAMIQQGQLTPNEKGEVDLSQVGAALGSELGIAKPMATLAAWAISPAGNRIRDVIPNLLGMKFNPTKMSGGLIHHDGDSDALSHGHFDEAAFHELVAHSSDGKSLTIADLGRAVSDNTKRDSSVDAHTRGAAFGLVEFSALINVLGHVDAEGVRRIDIETLRNVYQRKQLPTARMQARPKTGLVQFTATLAKMAWALALGGSRGTASAGVSAAEGHRTMPIEDAVVGVGSAMCPYMSKESGLRPISGAEVESFHGADAHDHPARAHDTAAPPSH